MKKETRKALLGALLAVLFGVLFLLKKQGFFEKRIPESTAAVPGSETADARVNPEEAEDPEDRDSEDRASAQSASDEKMIVVYLSGEVKNPGVYELPQGSRIYEALHLAGGLTEQAADHLVNLAEVLRDGEMVYFPAKGDESAGSAVVSDGLVDLNTASGEELMRLPGIGRTKAEAIIRYREENGPFETVEELMQVSGIGESIFERIREKIKV